MRKPKFLVDTMLGRLCTWLRLLGYDAAFVQESQRKSMLEKSFLERRILLTRETKLAHAHAYRTVILRDQHWWDQLNTVWKTLDLGPVARKAVFSRCSGCNIPLKKIPKAKIDPKKIPPKVLLHHDEFHGCFKCRKIFWPGSHLDITMARLETIGIPVSDAAGQSS
ncbi:MAG: hypothetical protein HYT79_09385 [Elusimicrobia bacterium]|nr:hypothetical protein [Elusimicrobiota bacterium]